MLRRAPVLLLIFAIASGALYSSLLPLWEGFDEAWHYGYVDHLAASRTLPVLGETRISNEVWNSLRYTPVSHVVQHAWPELGTFDRYFAEDPAQRALELRLRDALPHDASPSSHTNYEAQQPPLAYAVEAPADLLLWNAPIAIRILWLRTLGAFLAVAITFPAALGLFRAVELPEIFQQIGLFCIFACQMYWATVAHIDNDWLSLPLSIWFFALVAGFKRDSRGSAVKLALISAFGLLSKAYFLPLTVFAVFEVAYLRIRSLPLFLAIVAVIAGPWYVRNVVLYHDLSGLLMASSHPSLTHVGSLLAHVPWGQTVPYMLRATLWTGNNSFLSFSRATLDLFIALIITGLAIYAVHVVRSRKVPAGHGFLMGSMLVFLLAIVWVIGNDVEFLHGESAGAAPWYTIVLLAPALALSLLGMSRAQLFGRLIAMAVVLISLYICATTYIAKLIPLYSGFSQGRSTLSAIFDWYRSSNNWRDTLSALSLAPWYLILALTALVIALGVYNSVMLVRRLSTAGPPGVKIGLTSWRAITHRPPPSRPS